ncbi:hypothetical protein SAMN00768000_0250 [Sulfobacillus thermosulfidooxidans DSM 9293]|uniref:Uncharacterized protein n=1 Tax=Sulfobacillus thermosulfidooxidans (strain DSM 9293 / VKM B-1269 / AT-1) TaxID=929705 RepID=A0A1W1W7K8_SULTA|nr:hypothetical protein SAMN00768000_0250 [Sulfobacillus thermosulfidooxidans DSM 9293]
MITQFCIQCGRPLTDGTQVVGDPICGLCVRFNQRRVPLPPPRPRYCTTCGASAPLADGMRCGACCGEQGYVQIVHQRRDGM